MRPVRLDRRRALPQAGGEIAHADARDILFPAPCGAFRTDPPRAPPRRPRRITDVSVEGKPFLAGGGALGATIRAYDWEATPLGRPDAWPENLRTLVRVMLASRQPMFVAWGPERTMLYNDGYAPLCGSKHPWALGRPFAEVWADILDAVGPIMDAAYRGEPTYMADIQFTMLRNGYPEEAHFSFGYTPVHDDASGEVAGMFCTCLEITAEVLAARERQVEVERLREMFRQAPGAVGLVSGAQHVFEFANDALLQLIGGRDVAGKPLAEAVPEIVKQGFVGLLDTVRSTGQPFVGKAVPVGLRQQPGGPVEERLLDFVYQPIRDASGAVESIFMQATDMTERSQAEAALRQTNERLELALSAGSGVGTWDWDIPTHRLTGDARFAELYGADPALAIAGAPPEVFFGGVHPEDRERVGAQVDEALAGGLLASEYRLLAADGGVSWVLARGRCQMSSEGLPLRFSGVSFDITERRQAEEALRSAKDERDFIIRLTAGQRSAASPAEVMRRTAELIGRRLGADRTGFYRMADPETLVYGPGWSDGTLPLRSGRLPIATLGSAYVETLRAGRPFAFGDVHADPGVDAHTIGQRGTRSGVNVPLVRAGRWEAGLYLSGTEPRRWSASEIALVEEVAQLSWDAVERAGAERATRRRAALLDFDDRLRDLTDTADLAFAAGETLGRTLGVARAGYGSVDAVTETIAIERDWREAGVSTLAGLLNLRSHGNYIDDLKLGATVVIRDVRTDPRTAAAAALLETIDMRSFVDMPIIENGELVALLYLDHTEPRDFPEDELAFMREVGERTRAAVERRRAERRLEALNLSLEEKVAERTAALFQAEEQLRQMQKMEAVGQLTGGIAHDFNNMMAVVIGGLNLLKRRLARGDTDVGRYIDGAMDGAARAAALTQRLLAFSRQQALAPEPVDSNQMIAGMLELLTRTLGENVAIETVLAPGLWRTRVDSGQLENAILNLSVNARDAMPDGGRLRLTTANLDLGEAEGAAQGVPAGAYVAIAVADTGTGMPPEIIAKAFDPFFTTKGVGKGTGLGLSQVFGFISQSGGRVKIDSAVGAGTTVRIFLPRFAGEDLAEAAREPHAAAQGGTGEVVLVVEDEERVRAFSADALRELGYTVLETESPNEALRMIEEGRDVSLLFTDVVMPEMTGPQLAEAAVRSRPGLKVLFTTGYARNALPQGGMLDPGTNVLAKPFGIEQLAAKIRGALDRV